MLTVSRTRCIRNSVQTSTRVCQPLVLAARYLRDRYPHIIPVAVTCYHGTELERAAGRAIVLPHAAERSVVMTQSFTSMLIALQVVAALLARLAPPDVASVLAALAGSQDDVRAPPFPLQA